MENEDKKTFDFSMDGRNYYFDLKRICSFITGKKDGSDANERIEREIINNYGVEDEDEGLTLTSKAVREVTGPNDGTMPNIRYDLLKILLIQLITYSEKTKVSTQDNDSVELPMVHLDYLPLGTRIAFNSLLNEGIIKIKENQENKN